MAELGRISESNYCPLSSYDAYSYDYGSSAKNTTTSNNGREDEQYTTTCQCEDWTWLLHPSSGFVPNGSLCGILGPSGAGKSTFLNALGQTTSSNSGLHLTGSIWYSDNHNQRYQLSQLDGDIAMLSQYDNFFDMLTPRETLEFAYYLESSKKKKKKKTKVQQQQQQHDNNHKNIVERKLSSLGLLGVADRRIGDPTKMDSGSSSSNNGRHFFGLLRSKLFGIRGGSSRGSSSSSSSSGGGGLSGGERRRLSVALELISSTEPRLFLADEPTTGLDSSQAMKVIQLIHTITKEWNVPTLCTLHQPKTSIYKLLNNVILLGPGGKVCYCGLAGNNATNYFSLLGYHCPMDVNPAEFLIDLVSVDTDDIHQARVDESRINFLHRQFLQTCSSSRNSSTGMPVIRYDGSTKGRSQRVSASGGIINRVRTTLMYGILQTTKRFTLLLLRSWRQNIRNTQVILLRLGAVVVQAYLFSSIFASVQHGKSIPKSIADRIALLTYGVINLSMMSVMKSLDLFAKERRVVLREQTRASYTSLEYIVAKVIAEIPLDASFALVFAAVLKTLTGLRTSMVTLIKTYCLTTATCATLGFAIGSFTSTVESALTTGISIIVVLMVVGVINPSGVNLDEDGRPNMIMQILGFFSPIKWAIESLVTAEFSGMIFEDDKINNNNNKGVWGRLQDLPKMGALAFVKNGNDVLTNLGLGKATYTELMDHLGLLSGIYVTISWIGLSFFRPTFI